MEQRLFNACRSEKKKKKKKKKKYCKVFNKHVEDINKINVFHDTINLCIL